MMRELNKWYNFALFSSKIKLKLNYNQLKLQV